MVAEEAKERKKDDRCSLGAGGAEEAHGKAQDQNRVLIHLLTSTTCGGCLVVRL